MSNKELCEFLKERGIEISRFVNEKIDCSALLLMSEDTLTSYLPAYGDKITTIAFCKSRTSGENDGCYTNALNELRTKWQTNRSSGLGGRRGFKTGNAYAKKTSRRVELGWMDYSYVRKSFKQVRQMNGGGVRHLNIDRCLTLNEVLKYALDTFFRDGKSQRGSMNEFMQFVAMVCRSDGS